MSILAGFFYAMFFLVAERARERLSAFVAWWVSSLASTLSLFILCLAFGDAFFGYPLQTYLAVAALALVTQVMGYLSVNYALGHLPSSVVSPTLLGQPVITAILAVPLLGQVPTPFHVLGGLLVLMGIVVVHRSKQRQ
jgi:drug/metabolite transporter (DMT)-like permease